MSMEKIYEILSRHFSDEESEAGGKTVENFKKKHELEYFILSRLWKRRDIHVKDFNAAKAWESMGLEAKKPRKTKIIYLRHGFLKLAAAVAIFLMGMAAVYYFRVLAPSREIISMQTSHLERGKNIVLADGTMVWLNSDAYISYPRKFYGGTRTTDLRGEAFFQVKKDPAHPFVIKTKNTTIEVRGTSFNVRSSTNMTEVTVKTGKVKVRNILTGKEIMITRGYSARTENDKLLKFRTTNPNYLSWKTGYFKFDNVPIEQVVKDLNTYYAKKVVIDRKKPVACNLTAQFDDISLQDILKIIKLTCECGVRESADNYILYALKTKKQ